MKQEIRECPCCGKMYKDYPALSRRDNKTEICPECGTYEAMANYFGFTLEYKKDIVADKVN